MPYLTGLEQKTSEFFSTAHHYLKNIETAHLGNLYTTVIDNLDYYFIECAAKPLLNQAPEWVTDNQVVDSIKNNKGLAIAIAGTVTLALLIYFVVLLHPKTAKDPDQSAPGAATKPDASKLGGKEVPETDKPTNGSAAASEGSPVEKEKEAEESNEDDDHSGAAGALGSSEKAEIKTDQGTGQPKDESILAGGSAKKGPLDTLDLNASAPSAGTPSEHPLKELDHEKASTDATDGSANTGTTPPPSGSSKSMPEPIASGSERPAAPLSASAELPPPKPPTGGATSTSPLPSRNSSSTPVSAAPKTDGNKDFDI